MNFPEIIAQVCGETHAPMVQEVFGNPGLDAVFRIMDNARRLFQSVEVERVQGEIVIFHTITSANTLSPAGPAADFATLANQTINRLVLEIVADGRAYFRSSTDVSLGELAKTAVIYRYQNGNEEFLAGDKRKAVPRLDPAARSQFCIRTLSNLREALQTYAVENIRESTCYVFAEVWADENRLFFKAKPETQMRRSLTQFLRNRLGGDHDVWPEQNVNEKNPVDIRVRPKLSNNRVMLIEIKWLGFSVASDGHITGRHLEPRAQEGADQLVNYIEEQRKFAPSHVIQGYYVIIDARRRNLSEGTKTISRPDGMYYENQDIALNPAPHLARQDFDPPYRMFARPRCSI